MSQAAWVDQVSNALRLEMLESRSSFGAAVGPGGAIPVPVVLAWPAAGEIHPAESSLARQLDSLVSAMAAFAPVGAAETSASEDPQHFLSILLAADLK